MKKLHKVLNYISFIALIDKFLIIIMMVLIGYSFSTLFSIGTYTEAASAIDVVMRTAIASIFGYLMSPNFNSVPPNSSKRTLAPPVEIPAIPRPPSPDAEIESLNQISSIGFVSSDAPSSPQPGNPSLESAGLEHDSSSEPQNNFQIFFVGCLCLVSIVLLMFIRHYGASSQSQIAVLSQFRDVVCGCIGFLIGVPGKQSN